MRNLLWSLLLVLALSACSAYFLRDDFDQSLDRYNHLVRWHDLDAASLFVTEPLLKQYQARASAARDIRIVDYRIVRTNFDAERRTASVEIEIDYYHVASNRLKTMHDKQEWAYLEETGTKRWRLMSLLPEFK